MTKSEIANVMKKHPALNEFGYNFPSKSGESVAERKRRLKKHRSNLMESVNQCSLCEEWLSGLNRRKTVNDRAPSSYGLKHKVESWAGLYVTNGSLIAAAIHLGFRVSGKPGRPNVHINISSKNPITESL